MKYSYKKYKILPLLLLAGVLPFMGHAQQADTKMVNVSAKGSAQAASGLKPTAVITNENTLSNTKQKVEQRVAVRQNKPMNTAAQSKIVSTTNTNGPEKVTVVAQPITRQAQPMH